MSFSICHISTGSLEGQIRITCEIIRYHSTYQHVSHPVDTYIVHELAGNKKESWSYSTIDETRVHYLGAGECVIWLVSGRFNGVRVSTRDKLTTQAESLLRLDITILAIVNSDNVYLFV